MGRNKITPFPPWQTKNTDGREKRYIRIGNSQLLSNAMNKGNLSHAAFRVYIFMLLEAAGKREFTFPHSKYSRIISDGGFQKAKAELIEKGFIKITEKYKTRSNKYAFTDAWKLI